jgi:transcriptional regulator with GAF, ATPase, and Fis domain
MSHSATHLAEDTSTLLDSTDLLTAQDMRELDRKNILLALKKTRGRISGEGGAAELLMMRPTTLASRVKKYRIDLRDLK